MPAVSAGSLNSKQQVLIRNAPTAWCWEVSAGSLADRYSFANVQCQLKIPASAADAAGGEVDEIAMTNGTALVFNKITKRIKGEDESDITPATSSSTATGKGELTLVVKEAPYNTGVDTMTSFAKSIIDKIDSKFLFAIPMGFSPKGQTAGTPVVDGWAYLIAKRTNDYDMTFDAAPKELTLTFAANSDSTLAEADFTGLTMYSIAMRGAGATLTPPALDADDAADLIAGKVVIKPTTYA